METYERNWTILNATKTPRHEGKLATDYLS